MTFPSNELEQVLLAASRNETGIDSFLDQLLASAVFVPSNVAPDGGRALDITSIDNRAYVTVFTSPDQADSASATGELAEVPASSLLEMIPEHVGFAVNPGGDLGLPVYAETLRQAAHGSTRLTAGTRIRIGHPAEEPTAFLEAVAAEFRQLGPVRSARRAWAAVDDQAPGLVIGVDVDPDSPDTRASVVDAIGRTARSLGTPFTVDAVFTNDRDSFTEWMQSETRPFYTDH